MSDAEHPLFAVLYRDVIQLAMRTGEVQRRPGWTFIPSQRAAEYREAGLGDVLDASWLVAMELFDLDGDDVFLVGCWALEDVEVPG
jgi:hypothetical protein